jgi:hypothetical protein
MQPTNYTSTVACLPMELYEVSTPEVMAVLKSLHASASQLYEDTSCNLTYEKALVRVFHELWDSIEGWSVKAGS